MEAHPVVDEGDVDPFARQRLDGVVSQTPGGNGQAGCFVRRRRQVGPLGQI